MSPQTSGRKPKMPRNLPARVQPMSLEKDTRRAGKNIPPPPGADAGHTWVLHAAAEKMGGGG